MILLDTDHTTIQIAATALLNHALLLSANPADFKKVSGVRVENWLG